MSNITKKLFNNGLLEKEKERDVCTAENPCAFCEADWVAGDFMIGWFCSNCGATPTIEDGTAVCNECNVDHNG